MSLLLYILLFQLLISGGGVLWLRRDLPDLPRHLRKKREALHYETMAEAYACLAQGDLRYREFADYYRKEYHKRRTWLE